MKSCFINLSRGCPVGNGSYMQDLGGMKKLEKKYKVVTLVDFEGE